jgi:hypothetical protein
MLIPNYPEDSTLRRHVDAAAAVRLQAFMAQGPSDSTLRRHFEQGRGIWHATPSAVASEVPAPAVAEEAPAVAKQATEMPRDAPAGKGFFAWLSRMFGN